MPAPPAATISTGDAISPGGDRTQRRKARTRAALLATARHLFAVQGVEPTTIAQIAERADVAVGSFYNYFDTKDELLAVLLRETLDQQLAQLEARRAGVDDVAEAVSIAHRHLVGLATREPDWAWLLVRLEVPHRVTNLVMGDAATRDLLRGIADGRFSVAKAQLALQASGGALRAVIHSVLLGELGEHADSEHAEGVLRSFGVPAREAAEIAWRALPELPELDPPPRRGGST